MLSSPPSKLRYLSTHCTTLSHLKQLLLTGTGTHHHHHHHCSLPTTTSSPHSNHRHHITFSYNSHLRSLVAARSPDAAIRLHRSMCAQGIAPDHLTFPLLLKSCSILSPLVGTGKALHGRIVQLGFMQDAYIGSALVRMYGEFGMVGDARHVFDEMVNRDAVLWNAMVGAYVKCGELESARMLFDATPCKNVGSYNAVIGGYVKFGWFERALRLFDEMPERDVVSWNTVIGAHARAGNVEDARGLFDCAPSKNVVTWSAIISGFAQSSRFGNALDLFKEMLVAGTRPNQSILVSVLSCCAHLGALEQGMWIHGFSGRHGFEVDDLLGSSLIDMYSKCGMLHAGKLVFDGLPKRDVCSWNAMIYGFAIHGCSVEAIEVFEEMERSKIQLNDVTFVAVLRACSHAGFVEKGREIFARMQQVYGIGPKIEHYTCMIDLLSRANLLEEAQQLMELMPMEPDAFIWGALLSGISIHGHHEIPCNEELGNAVLKLKPRDSGAFVLASNVYASVNRWDDAVSMRREMEGVVMRKNPGCSSIEVDGAVHEFLATGRVNTESEQLYDMLNHLYVAMKSDFFP